MSYKPYGLICPITHACQIIEPRWTIPILGELMSGATRFNEIKRGVGNISTALLSKRLRELEDYGLVERIEDAATGQVSYLRTARAAAFDPVLRELAIWAQCNIEARAALEDTDVSTMMFQMHAYVRTEVFPDRQVVIQFRFGDPDILNDVYWIVYRPGAKVEICSTIPGLDVDLYVETDRVSLCAVLLGRSSYTREQEKGRMFLSGNAFLARTIESWLPPRTKEKQFEVLQLA